MNSRAKGARVEREAAKFLTSIGFPAERNARNGKSADDIVVPSLPNVHFEVKGDRSIGVGTKALTDAVIQSRRDAVPYFTEPAFPVVLWKEHKKGWRMTYLDTRNCVEVTVGGADDIKAVLCWASPRTPITRDGAGKE